MANEDNLIRLNERSKEERSEIARKGAYAAAAKKREKRDMKNAANTLLNMPIKSENIKESLRQLGFEDDDLNNQMAILVSVWKKSMEGDVKAAEFIRDTAGQKPVEKVMMSDVEQSVIDEVESIVRNSR